MKWNKPFYPANILFIDDTPQNVKGAQQMGIQAILFQTPEKLREALIQLGIKME